MFDSHTKSHCSEFVHPLISNLTLQNKLQSLGYELQVTLLKLLCHNSPRYRLEYHRQTGLFNHFIDPENMAFNMLFRIRP